MSIDTTLEIDIRESVRDSPTLKEISVRKSNQLEEQEVLSNSDRQVLIMDHHNVTQSADFPNVIIVNNQTSEGFSNKELSGAGVVYKVIQAYDEVYGKKILYKRYEDLAALGIVADMMDVRTLDNNAIIMNGLSVIHNNLFKALLEKQAFKIKNTENPNKIDIAFYIAPLINAVIRSGTIEEKTRFFEGFINNGSEDLITSMSRGRLREETLYEFLARTAHNLRATQNRQKDKAMESLYNLIEKNHLADHKLIIAKTDNLNIPMNITGLAAMELVNKYHRPVLLLRPVTEGKDLYYRGSGRSLKVDGLYDLQHLLLSSGLMDYCEGHDNAFGASTKVENIEKLIAWCDETLKDVTFTSTPEVDCVIDDKHWEPLMLKEFGEMKNVFGSGIPQPKFYFNFAIKPSDAKIQGAKEDSLKISNKGITFVAFQNSKLTAQFLELQELAQSTGNKINVEIIGRSEINEWMGYKNVQIMIDDIELSLSEAKTSLF